MEQHATISAILSARSPVGTSGARVGSIILAVVVTLGVSLATLGAAAGSASADDLGPSITSAAAVTAFGGNSFSFTVTTTGDPIPSLSLSGTLPDNVDFTDNGDGTGTLTGTPQGDPNGAVWFPLTVTATNDAGSATQSSAIAIIAPWTAISGTSSYTAAAGMPFDVEWQAGGGVQPIAVMTESGALPDGVSFVDSGQGYGDIEGSTSEEGVYPVTLTADDGAEPPVSKSSHAHGGATAGPNPSPVRRLRWRNPAFPLASRLRLTVRQRPPSLR